MTYRIVGSRGEASAARYVEPHIDDRVMIRTATGGRVERLGKRSSYTYQLEAVAASLRLGSSFPIGIDDAVETMQLIDACYRTVGLPPRPRISAVHLT